MLSHGLAGSTKWFLAPGGPSSRPDSTPVLTSPSSLCQFCQTFSATLVPWWIHPGWSRLQTPRLLCTSMLYVHTFNHDLKLGVSLCRLCPVRFRSGSIHFCLVSPLIYSVKWARLAVVSSKWLPGLPSVTVQPSGSSSQLRSSSGGTDFLSEAISSLTNLTGTLRSEAITRRAQDNLVFCQA